VHENAHQCHQGCVEDTNRFRLQIKIQAVRKGTSGGPTTHATADLPSLLNDASSEEEVQGCDAGLRGVVPSKSEQNKKVQGASFQRASSVLELKTSSDKAVEEGDVLLEANANPVALKLLE
jgi:hypothetical protein